MLLETETVNTQAKYQGVGSDLYVISSSHNLLWTTTSVLHHIYMLYSSPNLDEIGSVCQFQATLEFRHWSDLRLWGEDLSRSSISLAIAWTVIITCWKSGSQLGFFFWIIEDPWYFISKKFYLQSYILYKSTFMYSEVLIYSMRIIFWRGIGVFPTTHFDNLTRRFEWKLSNICNIKEMRSKRYEYKWLSTCHLASFILSCLLPIFLVDGLNTAVLKC